MALIVETGTGRADAEAYCSVADADTYHASRGATAWADLSTEAKEIALRNATEYMEATYRWRGKRVHQEQALSWPRAYVVVDGEFVDSDEIPPAIVRACAVLALKSSAAPLTVDIGAQVKSKTVGPITITYADGARQNTRFALVDAMLSQYTAAGGASSISVTRA